MKNIISSVACGAAALFLLWLLLSWVDVVTDNLREHPEHSKYNAFAVLVEIGEEVNK